MLNLLVKNWKLRVWCSLFQILICEPQSIWHELLVLSWLYCRVLFSFWISSSIYFPNCNALKTVNCCNQFWSNNYLFMKSCMPITTNTQNFYILKIHLNSFKISNHVLKFENLFEICKSFISPEKILQTWTLWSGAMWVYSSFSNGPCLK